MKYIEDWFKKHNDYLNSGTWKAKRILVMRRDGHICQACLERPSVQVHHLTYDYWGNEPLYTLTSVCQQCHDLITDMDRNRRNGIKSEPESDNGNVMWGEVTL